MSRKCVICGAKVRNHNPKTVTCDPICTRAKKAGRTRLQQTTFETQHPEFDPFSEWKVTT